jgi:arylsulfatase A-like enzyme
MPRTADEVLPIALRVARETPGPLLLWLHLMEPHQPYYWAPGRAGPNGHDAFLRSVRYSDGLVAGVLRDLRAARRRPLVVAVYGDHGEEFGEHGGEFHGSSVHAEQVRVALLLAAPGLPAARPAAPVSLAALPATILDLLGRPVPASMTEPSLAAALAGEAPFPQVAASEMSSAYCTAVGYTSERWRLVRDPVHDVDRLYDLVRDPYERRDLAASRPRDLAAMRRLARQWDEAR